MMSTCAYLQMYLCKWRISLLICVAVTAYSVVGTHFGAQVGNGNNLPIRSENNVNSTQYPQPRIWYHINIFPSLSDCYALTLSKRDTAIYDA